MTAGALAVAALSTDTAATVRSAFFAVTLRKTLAHALFVALFVACADSAVAAVYGATFFSVANLVAVGRRILAEPVRADFVFSASTTVAVVAEVAACHAFCGTHLVTRERRVTDTQVLFTGLIVCTFPATAIAAIIATLIGITAIGVFTDRPARLDAHPIKTLGTVLAFSTITVIDLSTREFHADLGARFRHHDAGVLEACKSLFTPSTITVIDKAALDCFANQAGYFHSLFGWLCQVVRNNV